MSDKSLEPSQIKSTADNKKSKTSKENKKENKELTKCKNTLYI